MHPKEFIETPCHHCNRVYNHHISLDMMAESIRLKPNLDRFYNACADFSIQWYRDMSKSPIGEQLCHITTRPADLDTMQKLWNFAQHTLNSVRLIAVLEQGIFANIDQQDQMQLAQDIMEEDDFEDIEDIQEN